VDAAQEPEAAVQDPEALWTELSGMDGEVTKEDYFDEEAGEWDTHGLQDDLALARQAKVAEAGPPAAPAEPQATAAGAVGEGTLEDPEAMLAHLSTFDPNVLKQDYFDDESGEWDTEGLKEDLRLAKEGAAASVQARETPAAETPATPAAAPAAAPAAEVSGSAMEAGEAPAPLSAGDFVLAKFEGEGAGWYTAVVVKDTGSNSFELKWDEDSTKSSVTRDKIRPLPPITANSTVFAIWEEDGGWYDAVVLRDAGGGSFVVRYDEDQSEATLPKEKIRVKMDPPKEPKYWAAPFVEGEPAPATGEAVEAIWRDGDYEGYHPAKVVKDNGDGTILVKWDEDESESPVKREEIRKYKERAPRSELSVGQKYTGVITNVAGFGAFVDFGSESDGMVHISRLAEYRVENVEDIVSVGQEVTVWISGLQDDGKVSLTMVEGKIGGGGAPREKADLTAFTDVAYDTWLTGTVKSITPFGFFVRVEAPNGNPAQGLVHCSEIRDGYVSDPFQEGEVGQEVQVRVVKVDLEGSKMSLSMKSV